MKTVVVSLIPSGNWRLVIHETLCWKISVHIRASPMGMCGLEQDVCHLGWDRH
ncbi:hypothetical protein Syun_006806 [Stephania yunnanensis]|uniref:Uncharacterized protein n=1 Tax=Stephania yunnanensis TaxID=152371 RepID=A0AAP0PYU6_9MAGN